MDLTLAQLKEAGSGLFPGLLGIEIDSVEDGVVVGRMALDDRHLAPNGYLHAAAVIGLADTACGYGCILSLPEGGIGFTTIELKTNFLRTANAGRSPARRRSCTAGARHRSGTRSCATSGADVGAVSLYAAPASLSQRLLCDSRRLQSCNQVAQQPAAKTNVLCSRAP